MNEHKFMLTEEGLEKLKKELYELKTVKRKEIAEKISNAVAFGEIAENAEYRAAKNEQAFIEGRILTLEKIIENCEIIDKSKNDNTYVSPGSEVVVEDLKKKEKITYILVDYIESDPGSGKISIVSPIGKALLGKKVGDKVNIRVPAGNLHYKILEIK
ncbi:MAG: transcription elongation factor GreA [Candidatus Caldatribacteriota bacterium]|jgi:transcription elongation factor GreA|uniref:Transcription elongation factor GreA n=1 Tax=uncultured Atribacterota bacterium TaxID=263865 RepID=G3BMJ9_9BACT|nr:transcription elongation factor [uncultured Atribacterota bacterium]ADM94987.1 transcription elongation factor [uncultured Atribacterota bacterium]MBP8718546.1 transcription elongation factor GreA [Candidatus Atribacteria bacterium]